MAETSILKIGADVSEMKQAFDQLQTNLAEIAKRVNDSFSTVNTLFDKTTDAINHQRKEIDLLTNSFKTIGTGITTGLNDATSAIRRNTGLIVQAIQNQGNQIQRSMTTQTSAIRRLEKSFTDLTAVVKKSSAENIKAIGDQTTQITASLKTMTDTLNKTMQEQLDVMRKTARGLGIDLKDAGQNGQQGMNDAARGAGNARNALRQTGDVVNLLNKGFEYLRWTITRAFYFGTILQFQTAIANIATEGMKFEQQVSNLQTVTNGNLKMATRYYQQINNLADHSIFSVDEMVKTALILNKSGLSPTVDLLEAMGKFAAGTGQSMFTLATSIANVSSSEEEQLKGLQKIGVKAEVVGDKLKVSYKGNVEMIDRSTKALSDYLIKLSKSAEYADVMRVQMEGVTGAQKRLSEAWSAFSRQLFFSGAGQFLTRFLEEATMRVNQMIEAFQDPQWSAGLAAVGEAAFSTINMITTAVNILGNGIVGLGDLIGRAVEGFNLFGSLINVLVNDSTENLDDMFNETKNGMSDAKDSVTGDMQKISDKGTEAAGTIQKEFKKTEDDIMTGWTRLFRVLNLGINTITAAVKALGESMGYLWFKIDDRLDRGDRFNSWLAEQNKMRKAKGLEEIDSKFFTEEGEATFLTKRAGRGITAGSLTIQDYEGHDKDLAQAAYLMTQEFEAYEVKRAKMVEGDLDLIGILDKNVQDVIQQDSAFMTNIRATAKKTKEIKDALNNADNDYKGGANRLFGNTDEFDKINKQLLDKQTSFLDQRKQIEIKYQKQSEDLERAIASSKGVTEEQAANARKMLLENKEKELTQLAEREGGKRTSGSAARAKQQQDTWTRYYEGIVSAAEKNLPKVQQIELSHEKSLAELKRQVEQNSNVSHEEVLNARRLIDQQYEEDKKKYAEEAHNFLAGLDETGLTKLADNYTKKLEKLREYHEAGLIAEEEYQMRLAEIQAKYQEDAEEAKIKAINDKSKKGKQKAWEDFLGGKQAAKDVELVQTGIKSISDAFGNLTANMDKSSSAYKALFAVQKAFAFASASVDAVQAWIKALNDPTAVTWPQKLANYASAVATTTAAIGQLMSVSMHDKGGSIPAGQYGIVGEIGPELVRGPASVTSRKDTADLLSQRGGDVIVNLIEDASRAGQVEKEDTDEATIIQVCVANIHRGGELADAISNTYGVARQGV